MYKQTRQKHISTCYEEIKQSMNITVLEVVVVVHVYISMYK